jgi:hypothetical protein
VNPKVTFHVLRFIMFQLLGYYGRWQGFKGRLSQLPPWARFVLMVAALPGIVLVGLSILAFLVSLLALLLLTVPLFRVLAAACGVKVESAGGFGGFGPLPQGMDVVVEDEGGGEPTVVETPVEGMPRQARRQVDVKIVE